MLNAVTELEMEGEIVVIGYDSGQQQLDAIRLTLEHHIQEEEGDIWPRIEHVWDAAKLEHAGQQMENLKREKLPHAA